MTGSPIYKPQLISDTMTFEEKLTALASVLPADIIEMLKAYKYAVDSRQYFSDQYDKAFNNGEEDCINKYFISDGGAKNIEAIIKHTWDRAMLLFDNWLWD